MGSTSGVYTKGLAETLASDLTPLAKSIECIAAWRTMRDVGCTEEDAGRFLAFIDLILDRLVELKARQNIDGCVVKYVRETIKKYRNVRHTYTNRRSRVEENGKRRGRHKRQIDYSYKASSQMERRVEGMNGIELRIKRQRIA